MYKLFRFSKLVLNSDILKKTVTCCDTAKTTIWSDFKICFICVSGWEFCGHNKNFNK